jgi:hypothetical protein
MACRPFEADGVRGVLCGGRAPRAALCSQLRDRAPPWMAPGKGPGPCPFPAVALCDYPIGRGRTCSAKICGQHRTKAGAFDHCPAHAGVLMLPGVK